MLSRMLSRHVIRRINQQKEFSAERTRKHKTYYSAIQIPDKHTTTVYMDLRSVSKKNRILTMQNLCFQDIVVYLKSPPGKRKIQKTYYTATQSEWCYGKH